MISILVSTCDSYHDVLNLFFESFIDNWPNCKCQIIINGEKKKYINRNLNIINHLSDEITWGARLLSSLNKIDNDYVIVLLDDYIIESPIDSVKLNNALSLIQNDKNISCIYLYHESSLVMNPSEIKNYNIVANNSLYKINTLPSIWNRQELIKVLEKEDDPWTWEAFSMYRESAKKSLIYSVSNENNNIYNYSAKTGGAVYRGKWVKEVVIDKILKYNMPNDFTKRAYLDENEIIKRSFKYLFRYKEHLDHCHGKCVWIFEW
jgi:hypothetical protein